MLLGSTAKKNCSVCVTVAGEASEVPLFVIFKGSANGWIAKKYPPFFQMAFMDALKRKRGWKIE